MNTDGREEKRQHRARRLSLLRKAWYESRGRFFAALALLALFVAYSALSGPQFLEGIAINRPGEPLSYSGYIWVSLFDFYFQGFWIAGAFLLGLGGLCRERATGIALFTLSLPVRRWEWLIARSALAILEAFVIALIPCLLIPPLSGHTGNSYPPLQAIAFALFLTVGGLVFVGLSVLLSSLFDGEYTAFVVGMCAIATAFFAFKARSIHRWSIFDVMSGARHIDRTTHLITSVPWLGLTTSVLLTLLLLSASVQLISRQDF